MNQKISINIQFSNEPSETGIKNFTRILNDLYTKSSESDKTGEKIESIILGENQINISL